MAAEVCRPDRLCYRCRYLTRTPAGCGSAYCLECEHIANAGTLCAICAARERSRKRDLVTRGSRAGHTARQWQDLLRSHAGRCVYCGAPATTRDHVVPLADGGSDDIANILPACLSCNSAKGKRTLAEWLDA